MRSLADATPAWVWVPALATSGGTLSLEGDAAHHVARVCRARAGEFVTLTDGLGGIARAEVLEGRSTLALRVAELRHEPPPIARVLLAGAPEGERGDWLVEKLVELGATALTLVDTERDRWEGSARRIARWERLMRAALQQSRRAWLPAINGPLPIAHAIEQLPEGSERWLAEPSGTLAGGIGIEAGREQIGAVGPSAGFTDSERDSLTERGFRAIRLSSGRLRSETAALALLSWWAAAGSDS